MSRLKHILKQFPFIYPSRIINSCKDWIDEQNDKAGAYSGLRQHQYQQIQQAEQYTHPLPGLQEKPDATKFNNNIFYSTPPAYLFCLKDIYLFKQMGLVISNRNALFQEFTHHFGITPLRYFIAKNPFLAYSGKVKKISGTGAVLVSPQSHNYYHWLSDVLPRIKLYESVMGHVDHFCVSASVPEKFLKVLPQFGVPIDKILLVDDLQKLHFDTLYVASLPGSEGRSPKWAIDHVRSNLLIDRPDETNKKIYFKRGNSISRKILNENKIIAVLQQLDFDIIDPNDLSVAEQAALVQQAIIVVGAHGAALANLVFANEGTSVIELFSPDYFRTDCYFTLSRILKLNYYYIKGHKPNGAVWGDINIDEGILTDLLNKIGNK